MKDLILRAQLALNLFRDVADGDSGDAEHDAACGLADATEALLKALGGAQ